MLDLDELLGRLIHETFSGLTEVEFAAKFADEVDERGPVFTAIHTNVELDRKQGLCVLYEIDGGLAAVKNDKGRWSLYETAARMRHNDHISSWAEFARGRWSNKVPTEAGYYFVRSLDGRREIHELKTVKGRLVDVSGGYVSAGKVSEWRGDWWVPKLPSLPESF